MNEQEYIEKIGWNVIQGRVIAEDEGIEEGFEGQPAVEELVKEALENKIDAKAIILGALTPSMEKVGEKFDSGEYLIPDMLASAECVGAAMDILAPYMTAAGIKSKGKFLLATVAGDLHDIGKNIVAIMLKGAGFEVYDLGNDVQAERIVEEAKKNETTFIGLSALLTTTMWEMEKVIQMLKDQNFRKEVTVLIGGAPTSEDFSQKIGADAYCRDAFHAIEILKQMEA